MPANRAILSDIANKNLSPKNEYKVLSRDGHIKNVTAPPNVQIQHESIVVVRTVHEQVKEKPDLHEHAQIVHEEKESIVEEHTVTANVETSQPTTHNIVEAVDETVVVETKHAIVSNAKKKSKKLDTQE